MTVTPGQQLAIEQLRAIEAVSSGELEIISVKPPDKEGATAVCVTLSIYTGGMDRVPEGLPLHDRERLVILVPSDFPFDTPVLSTDHSRFAGFPHVQWKRHICLYQSEATEWSVTDGMFGFIDRIDQWLRRGARNELDPTGAPLHPPAVYADMDTHRMVIPRLDTPAVGDFAWIGLVAVSVQSELRVDLGKWMEISSELPVGPVAAAILLPAPLPFEYPTTVAGLLQELVGQSVSKEFLLSALRCAAIVNESKTPLYVVVGTPMRGIRGSGQLKQHLAAWYMEPWVADAIRLTVKKYSEQDEIRRIAEEVEALILSWADKAKLSWCTVREAREEVTVRRDQGAPVEWLRGKHVAVWGCGALGGAVAEQLVRSGVGRVTAVDKAEVSPGVLTRQPYDDADIGKAKAEALRERLLRIRPSGLAVEAVVSDILDGPLAGADWTSGADVVVDATASNAVSMKLESRRPLARAVPIISMAVGHDATRGVVHVVLGGHTGGPADVDRRVRLACCNQVQLRAFREEFWPSSPRTAVFQPEPGCSESTFVGSAADMAALSGMMLNLAASDLARVSHLTAFSHLVSLPHADRVNAADGEAHFTWTPDVMLCDPQAGYDVRIRDSAWRELWGWIAASRRTRGADVETGGLLFGQRNDAVKILWVDEVVGPPPDSKSSAEGFICGLQGTKEVDEEKRKRSCNTVSYTGMWHTHPVSAPLPSPTDIEGMQKLCSSGKTPNAKAALVIVGQTNATKPVASAYVFSAADFSSWDEGKFSRICAVSVALPHAAGRRRQVGLALSGGGSRAIAFHLGCLRALHDRGILEQVQVVSGVSGGAVIAGMYAYSDDSFHGFDKRVCTVLRQGLVGGIAKHAFLRLRLFGSLGTIFSSGLLALIVDVTRLGLAGIGRLPGLRQCGLRQVAALVQTPVRRWSSRTEAFEATLRERLFGEKLLSSPRRNEVEVVINACELQTTSAFRFGSKESGTWRMGKIHDNKVSVATAVAASAAYPAFLPALDRVFPFTDGKGGEPISKRVILTDGGVYDNLGTSCLEPGRSDAFSTNVFHPPYIVCCDAGPGMNDDLPKPYWWPTRMKRSFEAVFRKAKDAGNSRLHLWRAAGRLQGFVLSYLGQQDQQLPYLPADLVRRQAVCNYPTDFSPMSDDDIARLAKRGEQLTRLLMDHYCGNL